MTTKFIFIKFSSLLLIVVVIWNRDQLNPFAGARTIDNSETGKTSLGDLYDGAARPFGHRL